MQLHFEVVDEAARLGMSVDALVASSYFQTAVSEGKTSDAAAQKAAFRFRSDYNLLYHLTSQEEVQCPLT